jgi:phosphoribosylformylglycinamidine synthase
VVELLPRLAEARLVTGAHDVSRGGIGTALARMAIASAVGAAVRLAGPPTAALFGEASGRAVLSVPAEHLDAVRALAGDVPLLRLGRVGGTHLEVELDSGAVRVTVEALRSAWETEFASA